MSPRRSRYERLSATADQKARSVFVAWFAGPVSGTLRLTADEAIAIGAAGAALKAGERPTVDAEAAVANVRDVIAELRKLAAESHLPVESGSYTDAADWLDKALGGEPS